MKKVIKTSFVLLLAGLFMFGCANSSSGAHAEGDSHAKISQKEMHELIMHAGNDAGWLMTEYKSNAILAENVNNDTSISAEIKFSNSSFVIHSESQGDTDSLEDAIEDALKKR